MLTLSPNGCPGLFRRTFWSFPELLSAERMVLLFVSDQKTLSLKTATENGLGVSANWRIWGEKDMFGSDGPQTPRFTIQTFYLDVLSFQGG